MRSIFMLTIIFFLFTACAAPTVTATPPPTLPLTATPSFTATPTLSPEQLEQVKLIDELIKSWGVDASEWNYSYNTETGKLGIYLAKNTFLSMEGEIQLTLADGSIADLASSAVSFDEQGALKIAGYKMDEETGEWMEVVPPNSDKLDIIFTNTQELNVAGVPIIGATSVDATARGFGLHELTIDPNTLDDLAVRVLKNFFVPGDVDNTAEATAWLQGCKDGATAERTEAVYTTTGGSEPETLKMVMNCGRAIPEGTVPINGVEFVYGEWFVRTEGNNGGVYSANPEMPWLQMITKSGVLGGLLVDKETGVLKVFMGLPYNTDDISLAVATSIATETSLYWINRYPKDVNLKSTESQYKSSRGWVGSVRTK